MRPKKRRNDEITSALAEVNDEKILLQAAVEQQRLRQLRNEVTNEDSTVAKATKETKKKKEIFQNHVDDNNIVAVVKKLKACLLFELARIYEEARNYKEDSMERVARGSKRLQKFLSKDWLTDAKMEEEEEEDEEVTN
ncbi:hypothetical protein G6F43_011224 [Rhizopus delemar]|nr:hypothetical protein G6F43_011224 [Rhizopus delemar]